MAQYVPCPRAAGGPGPCGAKRRYPKSIQSCPRCNPGSGLRRLFEDPVEAPRFASQRSGETSTFLSPESIIVDDRVRISSSRPLEDLVRSPHGEGSLIVRGCPDSSPGHVTILSHVDVPDGDDVATIEATDGGAVRFVAPSSFGQFMEVSSYGRDSSITINRVACRGLMSATSWEPGSTEIEHATFRSAEGRHEIGNSRVLECDFGDGANVVKIAGDCAVRNAVVFPKEGQSPGAFHVYDGSVVENVDVTGSGTVGVFDSSDLMNSRIRMKDGDKGGEIALKHSRIHKADVAIGDGATLDARDVDMVNYGDAPARKTRHITVPDGGQLLIHAPKWGRERMMVNLSLGCDALGPRDGRRRRVTHYLLRAGDGRGWVCPVTYDDDPYAARSRCAAMPVTWNGAEWEPVPDGDELGQDPETVRRVLAESRPPR